MATCAIKVLYFNVHKQTDTFCGCVTFHAMNVAFSKAVCQVGYSKNFEKPRTPVLFQLNDYNLCSRFADTTNYQFKCVFI